MRWMLLALTSFLFARPGFALPLKLKDGMTGPVVEGVKLNDGLVKSGMGYFVVTMNLPFDCLLAGRSTWPSNISSRKGSTDIQPYPS